MGLNNRRATRRDPIWVQAERAAPFSPPSTLLLADVCQVHRAGSALLAEKIAAGAAVAAAEQRLIHGLSRYDIAEAGHGQRSAGRELVGRVGERSARRRRDAARRIRIARAAHQGEPALDGFDLFLSLLHTVDTLNALKLDIEPLLAAMLSELPGHAAYDAADIERRFGPAVGAMLLQVSRIRELSASGRRSTNAA